MEMKKELADVKNESFALELIKDYKKQNKRQFIVILVILAMWFSTICYLVYLLNDIGVEETTTTETYEVEQDSGNNGINNFIHGNNNEVE